MEQSWHKDLMSADFYKQASKADCMDINATLDSDFTDDVYEKIAQELLGLSKEAADAVKPKSVQEHDAEKPINTVNQEAYDEKQEKKDHAATEEATKLENKKKMSAGITPDDEVKPIVTSSPNCGSEGHEVAPGAESAKSDNERVEAVAGKPTNKLAEEVSESLEKVAEDEEAIKLAFEEAENALAEKNVTLYDVVLSKTANEDMATKICVQSEKIANENDLPILKVAYDILSTIQNLASEE